MTGWVMERCLKGAEESRYIIYTNFSVFEGEGCSKSAIIAMEDVSCVVWGVEMRV
jgi:hypothetical protein